MTVLHQAISSWVGWLCVWMVFASFVALIAHGRDKSAARAGRRRTPERTLHLLELAGGWPGALVGMFLFHHKIRKPSYFLVTAIIIAAWIAAAIWWSGVLSVSA